MLSRCYTPRHSSVLVSSCLAVWAASLYHPAHGFLPLISSRWLVAVSACPSSSPSRNPPQQEQNSAPRVCSSKFPSFFSTSTPSYPSRSTRRAMSSEVDKAKAAAAAMAASSSNDTAPPTIFDKIVRGEIPAKIAYQDETALCFYDVNPQAPIHILCIPKQRNGLTQLSRSTAEHKDLLGHLLHVAGQVGQEHCPNGFRLVINDGADGSQSVYHLHIHILGGRQMGWPPG